MNKIFLFLIFAILLSGNVLAADIAYVVKNTGAPDNTMISALNELGYTYDLISGSDVSGTDFSEYRMILLGDESIKNVPVNNYRSLVADPGYYTGWSSDRGSIFNSQPLHAYNMPTNTITKDIEGDFKAYTTGGSSVPIYYLSRTKYNCEKVTVSVSGTSIEFSNYIVATKENPRRVFFGITKTSYWTPETKILFENSIQWIINGADLDGDGYYFDVDCNDNDPNVWEYEEGYVDSDKDGFGTGPLINICSGNDLPQGYSYIDEDCNDNNTNANPDAEEIFYNGIDDDCDGIDIADYDEDGYCKEGYVIQNKALQCSGETGAIGTDCDDDDVEIWKSTIAYLDEDMDYFGVGNSFEMCIGDELPDGFAYVIGDCDDNDPDMNPGSEEPEYNCRNDAPIVDEIDLIEVDEKEIVEIEVIASDPEEDPLVYSINDSRFRKNGNIFTWYTKIEDRGDYLFRIDVSDGKLTTSTEVEVIVNGINRAPICIRLPVLNWEEDNSFSIDLKTFCNDPDGDYLDFSISDSNEDMITIEDNGDGVFNFIPGKDWNGKEWVIFAVSDDEEEIETNRVDLNVSSVNDAPVLDSEIEDLTWDEDTDYIEALDLNDYFSDVDSNLKFNVTGNDKIDVRIVNGVVSLYPKEAEWSGIEKIIFTASDRQYNITSNEVNLEVLRVNKAPVFTNFNCTNDILEDTRYNCVLSATDRENDSFSFSVVEEHNLNCSINRNTLNYIGEKDYYGSASCLIRVMDENGGFNEKLFTLHIDNINDAPSITSFRPDRIVKMLQGLRNRFSITAVDTDSQINASWFLGNQSVGSDAYYFLNTTSVGDYDLSVFVTDGEYTVNNSWKVHVGSINEFKCSEVNGYVCNENQTCSQTFLGVYDSETCCPVACAKRPPAFKSIRNMTDTANKTGDIIISIKDIGNSTTLYIGDSFNTNIEVENRYAEDLDFEIETYFYDLTKDRVIEKKENTIDISKNEKKTISVAFNTEDDIKEQDYAIYVRAIGKTRDGNKYYNNQYKEFSIHRKTHYIIIERVDAPEYGYCSDIINVEFKLMNMGKTDETSVSVNAEIPGLKVSETLGGISIEKYDRDNDYKGNLDLKIPQDIKSGNYTVRVSVSYADKTTFVEKKISLEECEKETTETQTVETIKLNNQGTEEVSVATDKRGFIIGTLLLITLISLGLILWILYNKASNSSSSSWTGSSLVFERKQGIGRVKEKATIKKR